ncbi:MAG: carotenoid oxygenase [Alteromonadaceae bacterium]|nr:MAG: carotenoid oxygenase [Alteromonadaceae bacterium]
MQGDEATFDRAILFDFDGTLADTIMLNFDIMNSLAGRYKFRSIKLEDLPHLKKLHAREVIKFLEIPWYKVPLVMRAGKECLSRDIAQVKINPHIAAALNQLKKNYQLGIVTTNATRNVELFLDSNQIDAFSSIAGNARLFGKKRILAKAIKRLKVKPCKVLYIGDEIRDIQAAHACGAAVACVISGYNDKQSLLRHKPDFLIESPQDLGNIVAQWREKT